MQAIFNVIGELLESKLEDSSYGYRLNVTDKKSNNIFEDWREKYPEFRNTILNKLREPEIKYYICCDIKGYYDNIKKDTLKTQLRSVIDDDHVFSLLVSIIDSYSFNDEASGLGLPQGPAYARALANLYLNAFDQEIRGRANYYYRYVDDFFILFDDRSKASEAMEWVVSRLENLGLELSDSLKKEATIIDSNDESILQNKIDSVRYGLFEDFKFIPILSKQEIQSFYDAIIQKTYAANEKNKEIPTLIYFGTSPNIDDERKNLIVDIVEELSREDRFFPKNIGRLFSRLLDIYKSLERDFIPFFSSLEEIDKTYFLLALYGKYKANHDEYSEKLKEILIISIKSNNKYFLGFGLMICFKNKSLIDVFVDVELMTEITSSKSVFLVSKGYRSIGYFKETGAVQRIIDNHIKAKSNYLIKKSLLSGMQNINNRTEQDNELIKRILSNNCHLIHSECCRIISLIKIKNVFLDSLIKFIENEKPLYTTFISDLLGKTIKNEYKNSDPRNLDNLKLLFNNQPIEIQNIIKQVISRVKNSYNSEIITCTDKCTLIDSYNDCSYYRSADNETHKEIMQFQDAAWYDDLNTQIEQLQEMSIIPETSILYYSAKSFVILSSKVTGSYQDISDFNFSIDNNNECFNLFLLINNIYKKSSKYYKITGKIPLIDAGNIKIIDTDFNIVFLKKGKDLSSQYFCGNENIDSSKHENIAKLLYDLIFSLLFQSVKTKLDNFTKASTPKVGIQLYINYLLQRLKRGNISVGRVNYLCGLIEKEDMADERKLSFNFFGEKLKSNISKKSDMRINWKGITDGTVELYENIAVTYQKIDFANIQAKNRLFLNKSFPSNLQTLSKDVININLNLDYILSDFKNEFYFNYFQLLNLYGVYCLEIHTLFKWFLNNRKGIGTIPECINNVEYDGFSFQLLKEELSSINRLIKVFQSNENDVFETVYSLKEMGTLCLFAYFNHEVKENKIVLIKTKRKRDANLATLLMKLNLDVEKGIYDFVLRTNESLKNNYKQPDISFGDFNQKRKSIINGLLLASILVKKCGIKRVWRKYKLSFNYKYFELASFWSKIEKKVAISKTSGNPYTDTSYYYERSGKLYCESKKGDIFNVVISNKRITTICKNLKTGKLFGFRTSSIYSYRSKVIMLFVGCLFLVLRITYLSNQYHSPLMGSLLWFIRFFFLYIINLIFKEFIGNVSDWSQSLSNFISHRKGNKS